MYPKICANYSLIIIGLNIGTPKNINFLFGTNEKSMNLSVPILKHFRVPRFMAFGKGRQLGICYVTRSPLLKCAVIPAELKTQSHGRLAAGVLKYCKKHGHFHIAESC